ncbi:hypothetical protein [Candidatus Electronema sp. JM]|uniref:hypothetical protein n=1 Tax=Candidatus Electronema sp. JM TaxID=3401571 RepID=UPI003AA810E3
MLPLIQKHRRAASLFFVLCTLAVTVTVLNCLQLNPVPLKTMSFYQGELFNLIMSLSVIAVFMERAVEAILVPIRTPDRQQIEHDIAMLRADFAGGTDAALQRRLKEKEHELAVYRLKTARYAYWLSYALGMAVSVVGVRALSGLVDLAALNNLSLIQKNLFGLVDIVITGGVIAGGSAAIDKMGRKISETLNLRSATTSTVRPAMAAAPSPSNDAAPEQPVTPTAN